MLSEQKKLYGLIISIIADKNIVGEGEIDDYINQLSSLPMFSEKLNNEDIKVVKNKIMSERAIRLEFGTLLQGDYKYKKWFLNKKSELEMKYWERYKKYLLQEKNFSINVVNKMDDILDTLADLLGDPSSEENFQRRGLILGDVQSGKTSNYTGLICKASDAGYKVIVLLTGTIEKLRRQTQARLDEGFVGLDSAAIIKQKKNSFIGVGNYDPSIQPMVLTSTNDDFKIATARNLGFNLDTINQPVLFVVKKNVTSLKNLNRWLKTFNNNGEDKISNSLLVVDDESDNASVNTNSEDRSPTAINMQIRNLLDTFTKSSYVGFTATPFANIFIDPDTNDSMLKEDLFPKDYIYALNAPSNYIGARDIFDDNGSHNSMIEKISVDDIESYIPCNHKSDFFVEDIPNDLKEAIDVFLVANIIRDLRGDEKTHRSMLINVSRFTNVQQQISGLVNSYLKDMQASTRLYSKLDFNEAIKNKNINSLYNAYKKYYGNIEFEWEDIQVLLYKSIAPIVIKVVNQKSKDGLNYEEYENEGLRVITIGGLSLSRGLTLEGLMVSYLYRNSKMYDTLMQMGRWFGYRKNYDDLCKIWMSQDSYSWYEHINEATEELRLEIKKYQDSGLTPKDFGLRVRSDKNTLLVTARNKMRTASIIKRSITLSEDVIETPRLYADNSKNDINIKAVKQLIQSINESGAHIEQNGKGYIYKNVDVDNVLELLENIDISLLNIYFNTESIVEFLRNYRGNELKKWDVAFVSGESEQHYEIEKDKYIKYVRRSFTVENNFKIIKISGSKNRLGSSGDGKIGLDDNQIEKVKKNNMDKKNIAQRSYFSIERNPLLIIYHIELKDYKDNEIQDIEKIKKVYENKPLIGFSIGIPKLNNEKTKYAQYTINKIQQQLNEEGFYDIGDDE